MRETEHLILTPAPRVDPHLVSEVQYGLSLTPRQLPFRLLYDDLGSALFEAICHLPWYRVTRAEQALLALHGHAIVESAGRPTRVVELGAGSGEKLATLIEHGWPSAPRLAVELVDVSRAALQASRQRLSAFDHVELATWPTSYEQALPELAQARDAGRRTLALFLGSNIGNFDPPDAEMFLRQVRAALGPGDSFLVGTDLRKPEPVLIEAYDDPLGVTAAFNRNTLVRLNRELDGDFDVRRFRHRAVWNAPESRIEMHLVSEGRQVVHVRAADLRVTFEDGETIWTERSYKFDAAEVLAQLSACGFAPIAQWVDGAAAFAVTLAAVN